MGGFANFAARVATERLKELREENVSLRAQLATAIRERDEAKSRAVTVRWEGGDGRKVAYIFAMRVGHVAQLRSGDWLARVVCNGVDHADWDCATEPLAIAAIERAAYEALGLKGVE